MIQFVVCRGHNYTLEDARQTLATSGGSQADVITYDRLIRSRRLPRAVYVFTDLDRLSAWDLELAGAVYRRLVEAGVPALNDPARVLTRSALLRTLRIQSINAFDAYRWEERLEPRRYPVFLRRDAGHGQPLSEVLEDWPSVQRAAERALARGVPSRNLLVVEYAAEPVAPGLFRKLAVARVGERLVPQPCVHDTHWNVKYGSLGCATEELYRDELDLVRSMPFNERLWRAFHVAHIEYGRVDFGLVDGQPQIYEINTNPTVRRKTEHPSPMRVESLRVCWSAYVDALRTLAARAPSGPPVPIADGRLSRHQTWRAWFNRTRFAD